MMDKAEAFLRRWRKESLSNRVLYCRPGGPNIECDAVQGESRVDTLNDDILVRARLVDWIIDRAELGILPKEGDTISPVIFREEYQRGNQPKVSQKYEVMPHGDEPCFRLHGRDGQSFRIHTKRVDVEWNDNPEDLP